MHLIILVKLCILMAVLMKHKVFWHHRVKELCMYCLLSKMKLLHLNVNTKLSLFDTYIGSIVYYSRELWEQHPASDLESKHLDI